MHSLFYPTFTLCGDRGIIPDIKLPPHFRELVPLFYEQRRKEDVLVYVTELQKLVKDTPFDLRILLHWHEQEGLNHIAVGGGGLDLMTSGGMPRFQEHNMGITNGTSQRVSDNIMFGNCYNSGNKKQNRKEKERIKIKKLTMIEENYFFFFRPPRAILASHTFPLPST